MISFSEFNTFWSLLFRTAICTAFPTLNNITHSIFLIYDKNKNINLYSNNIIYDEYSDITRSSLYSAIKDLNIKNLPILVNLDFYIHSNKIIFYGKTNEIITNPSTDLDYDFIHKMKKEYVFI